MTAGTDDGDGAVYERQYDRPYDRQHERQYDGQYDGQYEREYDHQHDHRYEGEYDRQDDRQDERRDQRREDSGLAARLDPGYGARQEPRLAAAPAGAGAHAVQWDDYKVRLAISEEPGGARRGVSAERMAVRFFAAACALFTLTLFASFLF